MNINYWGSGYGVPFKYRHEIRDIVIALIAMTIAFALLFGTLMSLSGLIATFIAVLTGFLAHELMHREVARRLGYIAYFKAWWVGLLLALATSIFHFIIALPGATVIGPKVWGYPSQKDELKIALAGPATNMVFAVVFLALWLMLPGSLYYYAYLIYAINAWLGFFNLIPLALPGMMLDGFRVFRRDVRVWALAFIISIALLTPYILSLI